MRAALAIVLLAGCPAPPRDAVADPAPKPAPPDAGPTADAEPAAHHEPPQPAPTFAIESPQTAVWVVAGGACTRLTFLPDASGSAGSLLIRGTRISYAIQGDQMVLDGASSSAGRGIVARPCRTGARIGPGATLGGAEIFADEATCLAKKDTASVLDDSADAVAKRCRGEPAAVTTDEVSCGVAGRHAVVAGKPGCIGVALAGAVLEHPSPPGEHSGG